MNKKIYTILLLIVCSIAVFSCKKNSSTAGDPTRLYFPIKFGSSITYNVDSIYYNDTLCKTTEVTSQQKYAITDSFRDSKNRLSYLMNIYSRPNQNAVWQAQSVVYVTPTPTGIEYVQSNLTFIKLVFPATQGATWAGNSNIEMMDNTYKMFSNWTYTYQNCQMPYNNGLVNYDNTVTVLEDNDSTGNVATSPKLPASRTYYKEIYAYNVGMVYREFTHWTYTPDTLIATCKKGYSVTMRAVDNN